MVEIDGALAPHASWVLHIVDGDNLRRIVIPDGQVTERQDVTYVNGDAIQYGVTITCYPDASGIKAYIYDEGAGAS